MPRVVFDPDDYDFNSLHSARLDDGSQLKFTTPKRFALQKPIKVFGQGGAAQRAFGWAPGLYFSYDWTRWGMYAANQSENPNVSDDHVFASAIGIKIETTAPEAPSMGALTWRGQAFGIPTGSTDIVEDKMNGSVNLFLVGQRPSYRDRDVGILNHGLTVFIDLTNPNGRNPSFKWEMPDLESDGDFSANSGLDTDGNVMSGDLMHGSFYGPDHIEAAGVFFADGLVGAFGAKKSDR